MKKKSLVCLTEEVPDNAVECDDGWKAFRIQGVLDFFSYRNTIQNINSIGGKQDWYFCGFNL